MRQKATHRPLASKSTNQRHEMKRKKSERLFN